MSADLLRRAATRLRESALAATPGPWVVEREVGVPFTEFTLCSQAPVEFPYQRKITSVLTPDEEWPDLDYFALVHPPVALALAGWLADHAAQFGPNDDLRYVDSPGDTQRAIEVARAVLREPGTPEGGTE